MKQSEKKTDNLKKWFRIGFVCVVFFLLLSLILWGDSSFPFLGLSIVLIGIMMFLYNNMLRNK